MAVCCVAASLLALSSGPSSFPADKFDQMWRDTCVCHDYEFNGCVNRITREELSFWSAEIVRASSPVSVRLRWAALCSVVATLILAFDVYSRHRGRDETQTLMSMIAKAED